MIHRALLAGLCLALLAVRPAAAGDCAGDVSGDGTVGVVDIVEVILDWGPCGSPCNADANGDGMVAVEDLVLVIVSWGPCPQAACCLRFACEIQNAAACQGLGGVYQGSGTTCAPANPCVGGCCITDFHIADCITATDDECSSLGGNYLGDGAPCDLVECFGPMGACCELSGNCTMTFGVICDDFFQGAATTCSPNPCDGACCLPDGTCFDGGARQCMHGYGEFFDGVDCADVKCSGGG